MRDSKDKRPEGLRSSIWTVSGDDLAKFFVLYTLIYTVGSACLIWLQLGRDAAPHEVASAIITGVSLIGVGVAPSLGLVLTETWRLLMIFARALERQLEAKWAKEDRERERQAQEREQQTREREQQAQELERQTREREQQTQKLERQTREREQQAQERERQTREREQQAQERERQTREREQQLREREQRAQEREENFKQRLIDQGIAIGEKRGYERGVREAMAKMRDGSAEISSDQTNHDE